MVVLLLGSVLFTSIISGIFGMAGGMILMGILVTIMPVGDAMIFHGLSQMVANGLRAIMLWPHVYWRGLLPYIIGSLLSAVVMLSVAFVPSRNFVLFVLGLLPFLMFLPRRMSLDFTKRGHALFCGATVTACQLTAGVAGTVLDLYFTRTNLNRFTIVATKSLTQTFSHALKLLYFGVILGVLSRDGYMEGSLVVGIIVCALLGTFLGKQVLAKLSDRNFNRYTAVLIFAIGMVYLVESLRHWEPLRIFLGL